MSDGVEGGRSESHDDHDGHCCGSGGSPSLRLRLQSSSSCGAGACGGRGDMVVLVFACRCVEDVIRSLFRDECSSSLCFDIKITA